MNMVETDEMSGSNCYALNAIGSVGAYYSLLHATSSLGKEAVQEKPAYKSFAPGKTKQNVTIPDPNINREEVHYGMIML